jgi:hypothetical protein
MFMNAARALFGGGYFAAAVLALGHANAGPP